MKNQKSLILVGLLAMAGIAAAQSNVSKKLQPIYSKMDSLSLNKDVAGLSKYMNSVATKDFVFVSKAIPNMPSQTKTLAQTMATMSAYLPMIASVDTYKSKIAKITESGNTVTVDVNQTMAMTTAAGSSGPSHKIVQVTTDEDTWVKQGGSYKLKASKMLSVAVTQDGKQLPSF